MRLMILAVLAVLAASPAEAGLFRCRGKAKVVVRWRGCAPCNAAPSVLLPCQSVPTAVPIATAPPVAVPTPQAGVGYGDGPAAALAAVNAIRAFHGRGPLGWDATLASFAATNAGVHQPGSSGGGSQCWAGVWSYTEAVRQWAASPPHMAILLGAVGSVGISTCPTGVTGNYR